MADDDLISISEAARRVGVNQSTLSRQVKSGAIRSHGGKVRHAEVLEDRANNIDKLMAARTKRLREPGSDDADLLMGSQTDGIPVDGHLLSLHQAQQLKENYLAKLKQLEFEEKSKKLIDSEVVKSTVFAMAREDRDSLVNWPARVSPLIAAELGVDSIALAVLLEKYVREYLDDRSNRDLRFPE